MMSDELSETKGSLSKAQLFYLTVLGLPWGSAVMLANARNVSLIPGLGRYPEEGNSNLLQYSCSEKSMDRGARQATVHGVAKSGTRLSD